MSSARGVPARSRHRLLGGAALEGGVDAREDLLGTERLDEVVHRGEAQRLDRRRDRGLAGDQDHERRVGVAGELLEQRRAAPVPEVDVGHQEVEALLGQLVARLGEARGCADLVGHAQEPQERSAEPRVVLDQQHTTRPHRSARSSRGFGYPHFQKVTAPVRKCPRGTWTVASRARHSMSGAPHTVFAENSAI